MSPDTNNSPVVRGNKSKKENISQEFNQQVMNSDLAIHPPIEAIQDI
jgi:hypothetical protein